MAHAFLFASMLCFFAVPVRSEMYCGNDNCYELLGVDRAADVAAIKKAYRKLSLQWHPDKNTDKKEEATAMFQKIATAYEVLNDATQREAYEYYLDHPEERMYNAMRYYQAKYQPKTPLWAVVLGLVVLTSILQYVNFKERAKKFQSSPHLAQLLEEEYMRNCTRGRHGYQTGELNAERKAAIKKEFLEKLTEEPDCPLAWGWTYTLLPSLVARYPKMLLQWIIWRAQHHSEIQEEKQKVREEERERQEQDRIEQEEEERIASEKAAQKEKKAAHLAEKKKQEEEKRRKWMEEAQREAEEAEQEQNKSLTIVGKVVSVDELRKKGHFMVEVLYGEDDPQDRVQIVVDRAVSVGQQATVALEGEVLPDGKKAQRSKIAGEWSEGVLLKLGPALEGNGSAQEDASAATAVEAIDNEAEKECNEENNAEGDEDKKAKPRRRKK